MLCSLSAPRCGSGTRNNRDLIQHDGGIFDEHAVGKRRIGGERRYMHTQLRKACFVAAMLLDCLRDVDWLAIEECEFARREIWTDLSG